MFQEEFKGKEKALGCTNMSTLRWPLNVQTAGASGELSNHLTFFQTPRQRRALKLYVQEQWASRPLRFCGVTCRASTCFEPLFCGYYSTFKCQELRC